jgi:PASTA domain
MHIVSGPRTLACAAVAAALLAAGCGNDAEQTPGDPAKAVFSDTAPLVVVPRVVGRSQEDAHRIVERAGLKLRWLGFVGKLGNGRYEISCVKVLSQSPVAGERRRRGASVAVIEAACKTPNEGPRGVTPGGQPGPAYDQ